MKKIYNELECFNKRYSLYKIRKEEYKDTNSDLPFRVSPQTLKLSNDHTRTLNLIGELICEYFSLVIMLYNNCDEVKKILNKGKSIKFLRNQKPKYLFLRPDLIIDKNDNFKLCEIETSIFGLALADILNRVYQLNGMDTLLSAETLKKYFVSNIPLNGTIAYSKKVQAFCGQLKYLAENIMNWNLKLIDDHNVFSENIYRAFYSIDYCNDVNVAKLMEQNLVFLPSLTPQFEEKAILAFLWDKRFSEYFKKNLGKSSYEFLRNLIPPTFIVGEEENFELGLPNGINQLMDISKLPKGKRKLVLKKSGDSSWGEGITFLHKVSHERVESALHKAETSNELYIIQDFNEAKKILMPYLAGEEIQEMKAKIRLTPYYAFQGKNFGKMIAIKATGCENTDYIHGATNSINTSVS